MAKAKAALVSEICPVCNGRFLRRSYDKQVRCGIPCRRWDALTPRAKEMIARPVPQNRGAAK